MSDHNPNDGIGSDGTRTGLKALQQMLEERTSERNNYKLALETLNVEMEVLRGESRDLAAVLQTYKEHLDDAERRPRWEDHPDQTEIVAQVLRVCGVYDNVSDKDFDRACTLVKSYFAAQYPPDMRPDFPLKEGWDEV